MNAVEILKGKLGQNVLGGEDSISGLIFTYTGQQAPSSLDNKVVYEIYTLSDIENLGITAAYDDAEAMSIYRDLIEFYRMAGEGTKLYLMGTEEKYADIISGDAIEILLNESKGAVKQLAITGYKKAQTGIFVNGLESEVYNNISTAQSKANKAFEEGRALQIILSAIQVSDYRTLENFRDDDEDIYENISICIGGNLPDTLGTYEAPSTGTLLGTVALASVNENVGKVEKYRIDDPLLSKTPITL